jgi:6-bladed beta-propeller
VSIGRFLPFLACTAACAGGSEPTQAADWTVRDSAGVTVVSNHWDGSSRGCVTIAPDPTVTIPAGPAFPPLFRVRGGAVLADGRIAILNAGSKQLLFFGGDGRFQRGVGRPGSGPGEFVDPRWLGHAPGDTLFVWDAGLMRLTTFDGAGELLGLHQVTAGDADGRPIAIGGRFDDGSFLSSPGPLVFFDGTPGIVRLPEPYGRYDIATRVVQPLVEGAGMESVQASNGVYVLPFGKQDIAIAHGDVLVIGDNGTSELRWHGLNGQLRRVVDWVSEPIPVTARDRKEYREDFERAFPGRGATLEGARFAADHPRFSSLRRDRAGWLWVGIYRPAGESRGGWLVFDEDGVLRCSVDYPRSRWGVLQIGESYVLGVRVNENDEEFVVLHPLVRSP